MTHSILLVGLGRIGWRGFGRPDIETHYQAIRSHPFLRLVGGVDINQTTRIEFQEDTHLPTYESLEAALDREQPELAVLATPPETHLALGMILAQSVKGAIIEKPLALNVAACDKLVTAYRGKTLIVGHQRRYEQRHRLLRAFLRSEVLGAPTNAVNTFSGDYLNNGVHAADTLRFLVPVDVPTSIRQVASPCFDVSVRCERGTISLSSYGDLTPGYLSTMYDDLLRCVEEGGSPECSGEDGMDAVHDALAAQELAQYKESAA